MKVKVEEEVKDVKMEEEEIPMFGMGFDTMKLEIESALMIDSELKVKVKEEVEDVKPIIPTITQEDYESFVKGEFPKLDEAGLKTRSMRLPRHSWRSYLRPSPSSTSLSRMILTNLSPTYY